MHKILWFQKRKFFPVCQIIHISRRCSSNLISKSSMSINDWKFIECTKAELRLDITLACGQAFRWKEVSCGEWLGVFASHVWRLTQTETNILFKVYGSHYKATDKPLSVSSDVSDNDSSVHEKLLFDYFRLSFNLQSLYAEWCERDSKLFKKTSNFNGVRQLRQDPVETLFTFICSSNNNISRISGMVDRMCQKYGEIIAEVDGKEYYDFPKVEVLAGEGVEACLRELGFGYRAAYISQTARYIITNHSASYLYDLRSRPYEEVKADLVKLHGVGAKVADCVCLMAMDKLEAVPVDTHVWQLAVREYHGAGIKSGKSLTDTAYRQIGDFFRQLWGPYAGWAQLVAFAAELKQFQHLAVSGKPISKKRSKKNDLNVEEKVVVKDEPNMKTSFTSSMVDKKVVMKKEKIIKSPETVDEKVKVVIKKEIVVKSPELVEKKVVIKRKSRRN